MSSFQGGYHTAIDPKLMKKLPTFGNATLVVPCDWKGRAAAIAITASGVAFAATGLFGVAYGGVGFNDATLTMLDGLQGSLRLYGKPFAVRFRAVGAADNFIAVFNDRKREYGLAHSGSLPLQLTEHDQLLAGTQYVGGAYLSLDQSKTFDLAFREGRLEIYASPAREGRTPLQIMPYSESFTLKLSGPGTVVTGGGFSGGGFGLVGAVEGLAIATVVNAITRKSSIITVIAVADLGHEGFFVTTTVTPEDLRRALSPVFVRLRQYQTPGSAAPPSSDDLISRLERLSDLHSAGALTNDEFAAAKAALLSE